MPDLDCGHIFLTTLAPIRTDAADGAAGASHRQKVRIALAKLPTALQSPATRTGTRIGIRSGGRTGPGIRAATSTSGCR